ncbi:MAG: LysR family transcriptional regulator, partial [Bdellovibrionia bacterium]
MASESLGISQPLLSQRLKVLEELLGQPLFEYHGRKKVLNAYGREFHQMVKRQLEVLAVELRRTRLLNETRKHLRVGARKEILDRMIPNLEFGGGLECIPMTGVQIEEALSDRRIDIGITQREIVTSSLVRKKCFSDEFVLCLKNGIKTPSSFEGALAILKDYRFFDYDRSSIPKS